MTMNFEMERGGQEDSLFQFQGMTMHTTTKTGETGNMFPLMQQLMKKFKWHLPDILMMQWWRRCKLFFFKVDLIHLDSQKRWVTVAAERIRWTEFHFGGIQTLKLPTFAMGIYTSFITFQYLPISAKRMSEVVAISSVSLMHKPAAFHHLRSVNAAGVAAHIEPHLCVKGCGWTDRCERLGTAKKGCAWRTLSKGWEEKFDFLGVDMENMVRNETWIWVELDFHNVHPCCNVRDNHPNFVQSLDPLLKLPGNGLDTAVQSAVAAAEPAVPSTKGRDPTWMCTWVPP